MPVGRRAWAHLARKRIQSILRVRLYASIRQLESKISEAGPVNQRAQPLAISDALHQLDSEDLLWSQRISNTTFYSLKSLVSSPQFPKRRDYVLSLYQKYHALAHNPQLCGAALEDVLETSITASHLYTFLGSRLHPLLEFGPVILPGALDSVLSLQTPACLLLVEAKNIREWVYPRSQELWGLIGKDTRLLEVNSRILPVFVTRKIPFVTYALLARLGILGLQTHHQFFAPSAAHDVTDIKSKDGLGFHDILTDLKPPDHVNRFFALTVPAQAMEFSDRFRANKDLLKEYAITRGLERSIAWPVRNSTWADFMLQLGFDEGTEDVYT